MGSCPEEEGEGEEEEEESVSLSSVVEVEECPAVLPVCGSQSVPSTGGPYTREVRPSSYPVTTILIPVLLAIILLFLIVVGVLCIRKKKRTRDGAEIEKS